MSGFEKATRAGRKARIALVGPSGSGKTYSALGIASAFGRPAVVDTENGSARLYSDVFDFDVLERTAPYDPRHVGKCIEMAVDGGYEVIVIDSLSAFWSGTGGTLELVDAEKAKSRSKDGFGAWRAVSPIQQGMVDALVQAPIHVVVCLRAKQAYEVIRGDDGRTKVEKLGLEPIQRDMLEYEFDLVGTIDMSHRLIVEKSRLSALADQVISEPGIEFGARIAAWLNPETT